MARYRRRRRRRGRRIGMNAKATWERRMAKMVGDRK